MRAAPLPQMPPERRAGAARGRAPGGKRRAGAGQGASTRQGANLLRMPLERGETTVWEMARPPARGRALRAARAASPAASDGIVVGPPEKTLGDATGKRMRIRIDWGRNEK